MCWVDQDPYSASRGFWYAHIGWMLMHPDGENYGKANVSDLKRVPALVFQHKTYPLQVLVWGFIVPTVVAGFGWNDWRVCGCLYSEVDYLACS